MIERVQRSVVALSIIDAKGGEQFENLFFDGRVGRVQRWGQFRHILAIIDDVVETDAGIHDALDGRDTLDLKLQSSPVRFSTRAALQLVPHLLPTCDTKIHVHQTSQDCRKNSEQKCNRIVSYLLLPIRCHPFEVLDFKVEFEVEWLQ